MTREEAIELLDNLIGMIEDNHNSDYDTAFKMAIKALEQEHCEDLCKSCNTKGCIFQSGIKREKCDFYTSEKR